MPKKPEVILSSDGSHSIISPVFDTLYHSRHGAITESKVVFIQAGLDFLFHQGIKKIVVFEMGFGTGLNALLTQQWAENHQIKIIYHTVEAYPLTEDLIALLNYGDLLKSQEIYLKLHDLSWGSLHEISPNFTFTKWHSELETLTLDTHFDVVFFDAFGPNTQPALWQAPIMEKMYAWLKPQGVLTSFCAQGAFRRALKEVGFNVEKIPGPPGKREMTRAIKPQLHS